MDPGGARAPFALCLGPSLPTGTEFYGYPHASINGALHGVAFRRTKDNIFLKFVSVLNLEDEVFCEIALPKLGKNGKRLTTFISAYGNSLALFQKVFMHPIDTVFCSLLICVPDPKNLKNIIFSPWGRKNI